MIASGSRTRRPRPSRSTISRIRTRSAHRRVPAARRGRGVVGLSTAAKRLCFPHRALQPLRRGSCAFFVRAADVCLYHSHTHPDGEEAEAEGPHTCEVHKGARSSGNADFIAFRNLRPAAPPRVAARPASTAITALRGPSPAHVLREIERRDSYRYLRSGAPLGRRQPERALHVPAVQRDVHKLLHGARRRIAR